MSIKIARTKDEKIDKIVEIAKNDIEFDVWYNIYKSAEKTQDFINFKTLHQEALDKGPDDILEESDSQLGELISWAERKMRDVFDQYTYHWDDVDQADFRDFLEKIEEAKEV